MPLILFQSNSQLFPALIFAILTDSHSHVRSLPQNGQFFSVDSAAQVRRTAPNLSRTHEAEGHISEER